MCVCTGIGAHGSETVRWCYVRCRMHCYVDLIGRRKDGSALALGMERAVARGGGFYILDVLLTGIPSTDKSRGL